MASTGKKTSKSIFKTEIPFTETKIPTISPHDQEVILDLLCNLLAPLGHYRRTHTTPTPSPGKKRKRKNKHPPNTMLSPPPPALSSHILIGINSTTRHLTALQRQPPAENPPKPLSPLSLLIIPHPHPPSSLPHAHLPLQLYLSHISPVSTPPLSPQTLLLALPLSASTRLAKSLSLPRVSAIGLLEGAPGAEGLVRFARERVAGLECEGLEEGRRGEWRGVRVSVT
ncbi:hypothetical protein EJ04DRAFT_546030 [Polyplosphaeria fusca]|uniref:Uncharacterized protein n=1 Tax=Polyplosphaeria fusca TaxID=682080 RepID=A0A9P4UYE1_9PLEO|nr:hypothetical protein EJ04DRAFT_546030 [Polyplosphaeria fusca]